MQKRGPVSKANRATYTGMGGVCGQLYSFRTLGQEFSSCGPHRINEINFVYSNSKLIKQTSGWNLSSQVQFPQNETVLAMTT